ncbi:hypothetical protein V495_08832 [Pseudogymnoascus sp. VKM F-4514 (FW-929)]|nr:hypothetical protein V490_02713 [Pseudogymnoascus sp. VKM F-3557]KFY32685.1 hypothetical protein V495_08832 [Pseudogymnoascus sp. VKM F-4514 (FW-929)]KFY59909.1 hypothetical protein V497_03991 [Pseudogymnoascus sp. VKM F-4516 (FW-969)]
MTRLEPLIVSALGRSPYNDELIVNDDPGQSDGTVRTGQQYDDRGRPINPETTQRTKDLVRASNEVLQAAGIIEPNSDFRARDEALKAAREEDFDKAFRRRTIGGVLLTAGVWGTSGLRRRTLLYREYSLHPLLDIIRLERVDRSIPRMLGAGLPALLLNRAFGNFALVYEQIFDIESLSTKRIIEYCFYHIMFHYQYFATLQQLNLFNPNQLVPTLLFMVPFSSQSPLYLPAFPNTFTTPTVLSWLGSMGLVIAPCILLAAWKRTTQLLSNLIFDPLYEFLPHPSNIRSLSPDLLGAINELRQTIQEQEYDDLSNAPRLPDPNSISNASDYSSGSTESDLSPEVHRHGPQFPASPVTPTSDPRTLRALEGEPRSPQPQERERDFSPSRRRDSLATTTDEQEITQTTFISFDVEATDEPAEAIGSYSAELRNANYADEPRSGAKVYNLTATSLLPAHLAADALSVLLASVFTMPFEAMAVRAIGQSWRAKMGLPTRDMFWIFLNDGSRLTWHGVANVATLFVTEVLITGVVWGVYSGGMTLWDWRNEKIKAKETPDSK